ncbi:MAG: hypothetical protein P8010_16850 [Desulfosarcinaceae bacterium]
MSNSFTALTKTLDRIIGKYFAGKLFADLKLWQCMADDGVISREPLGDESDSVGEDGSTELRITHGRIDYRE